MSNINKIKVIISNIIFYVTHILRIIRSIYMIKTIIQMFLFDFLSCSLGLSEIYLFIYIFIPRFSEKK